MVAKEATVFDYQKTQHTKTQHRKLNTEDSTLILCIMYNNRDIDYTCIFLMRTAHNLCNSKNVSLHLNFSYRFVSWFFNLKIKPN